MSNGAGILNSSVITRAATAILSTFEDPVGTERPLWRDYSRWQGMVNFSVAAANNVLGFAARSSISWGYQDTWFPRNWAEGGKYGLYRTSYHVLYPGEPIIKQADNWYRVHPEIEVIPRVIDFELAHGLSFSLIANALWQLSNVVYQRDGVRPIIYTRTDLVNTWLATWTPAMLNDHYWWLAQYLYDGLREHPGPPTPPDRVSTDNIIMHQTSARKAGYSGEVQSASVDWDRWEIGNAAEMHQWISNTWGDGDVVVPPPIGECGCDEEIAALQEQLDQLTLDVFNADALSKKAISMVTDLEERVEALEQDGGSSPFARFVVTDDKTLAFYQNGENANGYPLIADYIYEPRIRWNNGDYLLAYPEKIRADGGSNWYVLVPGENGINIVPDSPVLYVKSSDVALG